MKTFVAISLLVAVLFAGCQSHPSPKLKVIQPEPVGEVSGQPRLEWVQRDGIYYLQFDTER